MVAPLAKGGLAVIYEAFDEVAGHAVALKRLRLDTIPERHRARAAIAFEREYFTLAQLEHPRVIQVYDYGLDEAGPYYTMELLDGVDLRERAPLSWRDACVVLRDVSSSLALLHSRHLLHHDLSPRNVRCTSDGHAKLFDFGAMGQFGPIAQLVGTPAYMAPEMIHGQVLDARSDLFGLGALAYFALSRQHAFPPTRTADLAETWHKAPTPLRQLVPSLPIALDHLIASLLSLDPMARPSSAAEVAGRLSAIAELPAEDLRAADAYLASPAFTARQEPLAEWTALVREAMNGNGRALLLRGASGIGRSRFLAVASLQAKLAGATTLHVQANEQSSTPYAVVQALAVELMQQRPDLMIVSWDPSSLLRASQQTPLVITVDDFECCDPTSAAVIAELALCADRYPLLLMLGARNESSAPRAKVIERLADQCGIIELRPLVRDAMVELLRSVFGDVPSLGVVAEWVQRLSRGNPRMAMDLAHHLVERGIARMRDGVWLLPESLRSVDLPDSVEQAVEARVDALSPAAGRIARSLALLTPFAPLTVAEIVDLAREGFAPGEIYAALDELVGAQILVSAGDTYVFKDRAVASSVRASLDATTAQALHHRLAAAYALRGDVELSFLTAHHLLRGGAPNKAYEVMSAVRAPTELAGLRSLFSRSRQGIALHEAMLEYAVHSEEPPRRIYRRRRTLVELAAVADASLLRHAPGALEQLKRDTGLSLLEGDELVLTGSARGVRCLERAHAMWEGTPDARRGLHPLRALQELGMITTSLCGAFTRGWDAVGLRSLPALLEPFLSVPGIAVTHAVVMLAIDSISGGHEVAEQRRRAIVTLGQPIEGVDTAMQQSARAAMKYYLGLDCAIVSDPAALEHADFVEQFPAYSALAWHVRSLYHACSGDARDMLDCQRRMELFALRDVDSEQFLQVGLVYTLLIAVRTDDLLTLQRMLGMVDDEAKRFPGWVPWRHVFRGGYHWLRGELSLARSELEAGLVLVQPGMHGAWQQLAAIHLHVLVELGEHALAGELAREIEAAAIAFALRPLEPSDLPIALAWAEANAGDVAGAVERIDRVLIEVDKRWRQDAITRPNLGLGRLHEARARLAMLQNDGPAFAQHAESCVAHYRQLKRPGLLARHERLVERSRDRSWAPPATNGDSAVSFSSSIDSADCVTVRGDPRDTH